MLDTRIGTERVGTLFRAHVIESLPREEPELDHLLAPHRAPRPNDAPSETTSEEGDAMACGSVASDRDGASYRLRCFVFMALHDGSGVGGSDGETVARRGAERETRRPECSVCLTD